MIRTAKAGLGLVLNGWCQLFARKAQFSHVDCPDKFWQLTPR
jgi:hypothetical protein